MPFLVTFIRHSTLNCYPSIRYYYPTNDRVQISSTLKNMTPLHPCTYVLRVTHHSHLRMIFDITVKLHKPAKRAVQQSSTASSDPAQRSLSFFFFLSILRVFSFQDHFIRTRYHSHCISIPPHTHLFLKLPACTIMLFVPLYDVKWSYQLQPGFDRICRLTLLHYLVMF